MTFQQYLAIKRSFQANMLNFLENEANSEKQFDQLKLYFDSEDQKNNLEFKQTLQFIVVIGNNHYRYPNFFQKIEIILNYLSNRIKTTFTNAEIFDIFKSSKRLLLFLIKEKILILDISIVKQMKTRYFSPEIKEFIKNHCNDQEIATLKLKKYILNNLPNNFDENRKNGENENYICKLIREDSIEDFIIYINKENYSLNSQIKPSIFETNLLLYKNNPRLIEYAAFYGSIQIFHYLRINNAKLSPVLWYYAIHGNNAEIIQFLEESEIIKPFDSFYQKIFNHCIKCHHNEIANYIKENHFKSELEIKHENEEEEEEEEYINKYKYNNDDEYFYQYYNYEFINDDFIFLCRYGYVNLVQLFLKSKNIENNFLFNIDDYEIISSVGYGIFGSSKLVQNKETGQKFIIKESNGRYNFDQEYFNCLYHLNFPSLLKIKGYCPNDFKHEYYPSILYDYYPNGSLEQFLQNIDQIFGENKEKINTVKYIIILGLAITINYLHKHNFYHLALRPNNVLIDENFYPILSDLEISMNEFKHFYLELETYHIIDKEVYSQPDSYFGFHNLNSPEFNTLSFAYIVYRILANKHPFQGRKFFQIISKGEIPDVSMINNEYIVNFLKNCLKKDRKERPNFDEIINYVINVEFYSYFEFLNHESIRKYLSIFGNDFIHLINIFQID